MSLLIVTLDNTILNVALPTLVRELDASSSDLQWIVDAYVLVFAGLMLVAGSLADRVGRKRTFLAGLVAFAACSTWAAVSDSVEMLTAARASMGVGAALIMPSTLAIITTTFTDRHERQRAIGFWAATSGAGIARVSFAGLHQLVDPLSDDLRRLPRSSRTSIEVALGIGSGPAPDRLAVLSASLALFRRAASTTPLLIVIDDLHWLDRATGTVVGFVGRRLRGSRIGLLGAIRPEAGGFFERAGLS